MSDSILSNVLKRLRTAADETARAWPTFHWHKVSGPGAEEITLNGNGNFAGMVFEPGKKLVYRAELTAPASAAGVPLVGDALETTLFSLYPVELYVDETSIFAEDGVPVAAGPALFTLVPSLREGSNGEILMRVNVPNNQTSPWFNMQLTTPGLRARTELLDIAWAELAFADALAVSQSEQQAVLAAAALVPENLALFTPATLAAIEETLLLLSAKAKQHFVHVIGHSHIDMNWLWTMNDTLNVIQRDFASVLAIMDDYPEFTFTHSQPATYEVVRKQAPALFARVVEYIRQGRWEPATLTWVEGDTNMASGEAHARHFLESAEFTRNELKTTATSMLEPDTFGHAGNLPQLAVSAGAERYYHHRANPGQADLLPAYWWEGQDGTRLLAISTPSYNGGISARDLVQSALRGKKHGHTGSLHFHGVGDHGGGPARHNLDTLRNCQQHPLLPSAQCSTLAAYTRQLLDSGVSLPVWQGESSTIFEGCYTTHADIKEQNRSGENLLSTADTLSALAGVNAKAQLHPAWRTVLFNQFHDIFDGSGIHETYYQSTEDASAVAAAAQAVTQSALHVLQSGLAAGSVAVTNPLGWERTDWVQVKASAPAKTFRLLGSHGHCALAQQTADGFGFAARVPAFGTVSYTIHTAEAVYDQLKATPAFAPTDSREANWLTSQNEQAPYFKIETPFFRAYLRNDCGILVSFYDKRAGKELVAYGMRRGSDYQDSARPDLALHVLQLDEEYPHGMSAWHLDEVHTTHSLLRGAVTELVESGPARLVFETTHTLRSSTIRQRTIFYRDLARVDFESDVDWQELGSATLGVPNLKVAFTARLMHSDAWFETPFAAVRRPSDGQEVSALRWADVGGDDYGFAVLNDSKYAYDALGGRLRLSLLRSGYEPDSISDVGKHSIRYSFLPHVGSWQNAGVVRHAAGFNQPLLAGLLTEGISAAGEAAVSSFVPQFLGAQNIIPACLKTTHDGGGTVIRLYESIGQAGEIELRGLPEDAVLWETNIIEQKQCRLPLEQGCARLSFTPWQVRTLLVETPGK